MTTYFVDFNNGSDSADGLTDLNPRLTLSGLTLSNGDRVLVKRGGLWAVASQYSAQNATDITITTYGDGPRPIIRNAFDADAESNVMMVENRTRWTFDGLKFVRDRPTIYRSRAPIEFRGLSSGGGHIVRNCDFEGGGDSFRIIQQVPAMQVYGCTFTGAFTDAFWASSGTGLVLKNSQMFGYGIGDANGDGIQLSACLGAATIEENTIDMPLVSVKQGIFCQSTDAGAIVYIRRNRVNNPGSSTSALISIEGQGTIENNIVTGNASRAYSLISRTAGHTVCRIRGNLGLTGLASPQYGIYVSGSHIKDVEIDGNTLIGLWDRAVFIGTGATPAGSTYDGGNNVIDCLGRAASTAFWNDGALAITSNTDCVHRTAVNSQGATGVTLSGLITADPMLTGDYRPRPGSPLIGAGTHLGYVRDLDGKQRPNPPSIGAYDLANVTTRPRTVG